VSDPTALLLSAPDVFINPEDENDRKRSHENNYYFEVEYTAGEEEENKWSNKGKGGGGSNDDPIYIGKKRDVKGGKKRRYVIDADSIDVDDVIVSNGAHQFPPLEVVDTDIENSGPVVLDTRKRGGGWSQDDSPLTVEYEVSPPGGRWTSQHNGEWIISVNHNEVFQQQKKKWSGHGTTGSSPDQLRKRGGNWDDSDDEQAVVGGQIGTFHVYIQDCIDGIKNNDEEGIDCGGEFCNECPELTLTLSGARKRDVLSSSSSSSSSSTSIEGPSRQFKYTLALNNGNHGSIDDVVVSVTVRAPPGVFLRDLVALKSVE
jgi:hypothetical protein